MFTIASLGAIRRYDDQGNWVTVSHAVITMPSEADLPGLVVDAEAGQVVWCEAEETAWIFNGTAHVPLGTGTKQVTWETVSHRTGTGPGSVNVAFDWTAYSRYRVTLELDFTPLTLSAPPGLWQGVQTSSASGSSAYGVTGTTLGPQGRWTGTLTAMHHYGSLDLTLSPNGAAGEVIRIDAESIWLAPDPAALTLSVAAGDFDILVEAHS